MLENPVLQNSVFEQITGIDFPDSSFRVKYTLPTEVSTYLANY